MQGACRNIQRRQCLAQLAERVRRGPDPELGLPGAEMRRHQSLGAGHVPDRYRFDDPGMLGARLGCVLLGLIAHRR